MAEGEEGEAASTDPAVQRARELTEQIEELERQSQVAREAGAEEVEKAIDRLIIQKQEEIKKLFGID